MNTNILYREYFNITEIKTQPKPFWKLQEKNIFKINSTLDTYQQQHIFIDNWNSVVNVIIMVIMLSKNFFFCRMLKNFGILLKIINQLLKSIKFHIIHIFK